MVTTEKFFKTHKKPSVSCVALFHGEENYAEWCFELPIECAMELQEKYNIPRYLGVARRDYKGIDKDGKPLYSDPKKDVLLLNYEDISLEYILDTTDDDSDDWDYLGDDYRTAKDHAGKERIYLEWTYDCLDHSGEISMWEGYEGDEYFSLSDFDYELPEFMNGCHPSIEITGEDKEKLLLILHQIMDEVLDGDPEEKKKLYF